MNYAELAAEALALVAENGKPIVVTRKVKGAYDPVTASVAVTEVVESGSAVEASRKRSVDPQTGRTLEVREVWIAGAVCDAGDEVLWDELPWMISVCEPVAPDGTLIISKAELYR